MIWLEVKSSKKYKKVKKQKKAKINTPLKHQGYESIKKNIWWKKEKIIAKKK